MKAFDNAEKNKTLGGMLYVVATPIGNLADISERALKVLSEVDFIAAEDTRNSLRLLTHFGISKTLVSYHEHNKREKGEEIVARLRGGESCAIITDAGTPAISDPGEDLVALCAENDIPVTSVPGACALISALALSGLPTARFVFEGFLPQKKGRQTKLNSLTDCKYTMVFYESPFRLVKTLEQLAEVLGSDRRAAVCREITKLHEETQRGTLAELSQHYTEKGVKGEIVIIVAGTEE